MRRGKLILILLALLAGGCGGVFGDPFPRDKSVDKRIPAGGSERDTVELDSGVQQVFWDEIHVGDLPPGIHYETKAVYVDPAFDELILDYRIRVDEGVEPGFYSFKVRCEYVENEYDWFRTEVDVRFSVHVPEPAPDAKSGPLDLEVLQSVPANQPEVEVLLPSAP